MKSFICTLFVSSVVAVNVFAGEPVVSYSPPASFDPLTASSDALAVYGFPPNPGVDDLHYKDWKALVSAPVTRKTPSFRLTFHGLTIRNNPAQVYSSDATFPTLQSGNWAGYATSRQYATGVTSYSMFTVPEVKLPSTCGINGAFIDEWGGFDGLTNSTVEQAGVLTGISCSGQEYAPMLWYESYPNPSIFFADVNPSDLIREAVTINGSTMLVYTIDYSQDTSWSFSVTLSAPPALASAEFIVEAPYVCSYGICGEAVLGVPTSNGVFSIGDYTANPSTNPSSSTQYIINLLGPRNMVIATSKPNILGDSVYIPDY